MNTTLCIGALNTAQLGLDAWAVLRNEANFLFRQAEILFIFWLRIVRDLFLIVWNVFRFPAKVAVGIKKAEASSANTTKTPRNRFIIALFYTKNTRVGGCSGFILRLRQVGDDSR